MDARTSARPSGIEDPAEVDDERRKWLKRVSRRCSQPFVYAMPLRASSEALGRREPSRILSRLHVGDRS